jgi:hypothetical protein
VAQNALDIDELIVSTKLFRKGLDKFVDPKFSSVPQQILEMDAFMDIVELRQIPNLSSSLI